jgi:hypothetical protein
MPIKPMLLHAACITIKYSGRSWTNCTPSHQSPISTRRLINTRTKIRYLLYVWQFNPINFGNAKIYELASDMVGPEQVSPHYENFMMSRKYALSKEWVDLAFWAGTFFLVFCINMTDLHWMARAMFFPWIVSFGYLYFFLEARKSLVKYLKVL